MIWYLVLSVCRDNNSTQFNWKKGKVSKMNMISVDLDSFQIKLETHHLQMRLNISLVIHMTHGWRWLYAVHYLLLFYFFSWIPFLTSLYSYLAMIHFLLFCFSSDKLVLFLYSEDNHKLDARPFSLFLKNTVTMWK